VPYTIRKQKCKRSDGCSGSYTLSYTDKNGKHHSNCHGSRASAQAQIGAIESEGVEPDAVENEQWITRTGASLGEDELTETVRILEALGPAISVGAHVRSAKTSREMLIHNDGKPMTGIVTRVWEKEGQLVADVEWSPLPRHWEQDDTVLASMDDMEAEENTEIGVPLRRLRLVH